MTDETPTPPRFTLRDLPVSAKLVLTAFLAAVGLGYFSALVQLHTQHSSRKGDHLPTPDDVIEHFSGLKLYVEGDIPKSKIESLISGPRDAGWGKTNMTPAFFEKSSGFDRLKAEVGDEAAHAMREGERRAMIAWINADPEARLKAYDNDAFPRPAALKEQPITDEMVDPDTGDVLIFSLIEARCVRCHVEGDQFPALDHYNDLLPLIQAPRPEVVHGKFGEEWVRSGKQISVEGLTQSTHAHLLSFAVLFALTGLITALSRLPAWLRVTLAPMVLIAQVVDIACWWLARVPEYGPYFAQTIILTGTVVGGGLVLQIILGLFSMYDRRARVAMILIVLAGLIGVGLVYVQAIRPALDRERVEYERRQTEPADSAELIVKANTPPETAPAGRPVDPPPVVPERKLSQLDKLITGPIDGAPWDGTGSMAAAFFHKDGDDYKEILEDGDMTKAELDAERTGEQLAMQAWIVADPALRKKAYEADAFALPADRVGQPITGRYLSDDKAAVAITTLLEERCVRCHHEEESVFEYPLGTYDQLLKYMGPPAAAKAEDQIPRAD